MEKFFDRMNKMDRIMGFIMEAETAGF